MCGNGFTHTKSEHFILIWHGPNKLGLVNLKLSYKVHTCLEQWNLAVTASKHIANSETQVKSRILSNAEKEIISSTTEAWSNVMFTCKEKKKQKKNNANLNKDYVFYLLD
jgi:hypothetical protein